MEQVDQKELWGNQDGLQFAELCNALYERELRSLANSAMDDLDFFKSRINSLPYYVKRTAEHMLLSKNPLTIDTQNGTWRARQPTQNPQHKSNKEALANWLVQHACLGLVLPIWQEWRTEQVILLDSIDRIDAVKQRIRLNEHGWFSFHGDEEKPNGSTETRVLLPHKTIMASACCGHRWNVKGRITPRTLSLRELLLSTVINWQNFSRPQMANSKI